SWRNDAMDDRRMATRRAIFTLILTVSAVQGAPVAAAPPDPLDDGAGREWRQLYQTTGLTWSQVAQVCPRDGETPCAGGIGGRDLTGWVWGTADQVIDLLGNYAPNILTADPPSVAGPEYFGLASGFLSAALRWTFFVAGYNFYYESAAGWTAST